MSPSWYDLLGVETDASTEEIRAAWKAAIADLDPSDRRFRLLNQAAEVLLDPTARAAYDEALDVAAATEPEPVPEADSPGLVTGASAPSSTTDGGDELTPAVLGPREPRRPVSGWVLVALAAVTAVMVALAAWLATKPSDTAVADGTSDAQGAAESAAATILSYDYRTMDEDREAAGALMTADYRKEYDRLFSALEKDAAEVKIQVTTELVASGIERAGSDRVKVLVFVNRPTLNAQLTEPVVYRDQVTMTMEDVDGEWLVDGLETTPVEA